MNVLDPLRWKAEAMARVGVRTPLDHARKKFGSPTDYQRLASEIEMTWKGDGWPILVDLSPFERMGWHDPIVEILEPVTNTIPLVFMATDNQVYNDLQQTGLLRASAAALYGPDGRFMKLTGHGASEPRHRWLARTLRACDTLSAFRRDVAHWNLLRLLTPSGVLYPDTRKGSPPYGHTEERHGRQYFRTPAGVLISCYVNLKEVVATPERRNALVYEVIYSLYEGFRRSPILEPPVAFLIAPNDTSLLIASGVQALTELPVALIDHMGPIPSKRITGAQLSVAVKDQPVAVIADVTATGGELDRMLLFLGTFLGADVRRVLACYELEVGGSMLAKHYPATFLCQPKRELGYVFRSA